MATDSIARKLPIGDGKQRTHRGRLPWECAARGGCWRTGPRALADSVALTARLEADAQADLKRDVNSTSTTTTATTVSTCFYGSLSFHGWILLSDFYFRIHVRRARQLVALSLGSCVGYFVNKQNSPSDPSQRRSRYGLRLAAHSITALPTNVADCI